MLSTAIDIESGKVLMLETSGTNGSGGSVSNSTINNMANHISTLESATSELETAQATLQNDLGDLGDQVLAIQGDLNILKSSSSSSINNSGIRADYALKYGITDCPNGIISFNSTDKELTIHQGVTLSIPNKEAKVIFGNDTTYEVEETGNVVLFYTQTESESGTVQQGFLEAGTVYYGENEPKDGVTSFLAWWQPSKGKWQFKSVYTGNVWREADAQPIANIKASSSIITSVNYIGYRIIDDDIFAQLSDIENLQTQIQGLLTRIEALENN